MKAFLLVLSALLAAVYSCFVYSDMLKSNKKCDAAYRFAEYFSKEVAHYLTPADEIARSFDGESFETVKEASDFVRLYLSPEVADEIGRITVSFEAEALERAVRLREKVDKIHEKTVKKNQSRALTKGALPVLAYFCAVILII